MNPIKISPLVLALTGIAEKNPTSTGSMFESLKVIVEELNLHNAWALYHSRAGRLNQMGYPDAALPASVSLDLETLFPQGSRHRIFASEGRYWIAFALRGGGALLFEKRDPFLIGDHVEDFASYLSVYFNGMIEWNHREDSDREVQKSHFLLNQIINAIPEMLAFKDEQGTYLVANKKAEETFSHRFATIVGKRIEDIYPPQEVEFIRALDREAITGDQPLRREIEMMTETGFIQVETVRVPVKGEDGKAIGIISMSRDITEKKKTEKQIKHFVEFQDTLMKIATRFINVPESKADEAIDTALALAGSHIDADRVYVFDYHLDQGLMHNTYEWCRQGISPEIQNLQNVPTADFLDNWIRAHSQGESVYIYDVFAMDPAHPLYQVLTPQGIQSILTIPLINQDRLLGFVGFDAVRERRHWSTEDQSLLKVLAELIVNLKLRQEKENELVITRQKAETANLAKSEFLANMSHEIRTPLSGIYNALYLLYNTSLNIEQQEYIDIANASIESLSGIVNNILDLAKIESGKIELQFSSFDLEDEIYQIAKMEEYSALEKGLLLLIDMDFSIPRGLIHDRLRLRQILLNLTHNAIKFTEKGFVEIQTKLERIDSMRAYVGFSVRDSGIGISKDLLSVITEKFVQGDSSGTKRHAGTGLGLAIVKHLVEQFGGTLSIASEVGKGSKFSFVIPFEIDPSVSPQTWDGLRGKTLARIDPRPQTGDHPTRFFESMGMTVLTASIQELNKLNQPMDIVLFESTISDFDETALKTVKANPCCAHAIIAMLMLEPAIATQGSLKSKGIDVMLSMPTTRQRVYRLMTYGYEDKGIMETEIPDNWSVDGYFSGIRVLVVDDNRINRQALELILRRSGFLVTLAQNGYEAVDLALKLDFDIVLMDIQMPGIDGYETTKRIRSLSNGNATIPIVAVTANALPSAKELALEVGMNETIVKPLKTEQIFRLVDNYLVSKRIQRKHHLSISVPATLNVLHWADFTSRFEGMFDLAKQVVAAFREDLSRDLKQIHDAVQDHNFEAIRKAAHYLKGSAAYVGAERVVWICQHMIEETKMEKFDEIILCDRMLDKETDDWLNEIKQYEIRGALH